MGWDSPGGTGMGIPGGLGWEFQGGFGLYANTAGIGQKASWTDPKSSSGQQNELWLRGFHKNSSCFRGDLGYLGWFSLHGDAAASALSVLLF